MASTTTYLLVLVVLEVFCQCNALWSDENRQELVLYPRVGKRAASPDPHVMRRRDFLNFLANSWQRTGSLRGAIHEIQDMTESKRSGPQPLIFPGPRVGRSVNDEPVLIAEPIEQQQEMEKKWSKARIGKKSSGGPNPVAILGDEEGNTITYFEEPKRVPFARLG